MLFPGLRRSVGDGADNEPDDIVNLKRAFAAMGRFRPGVGGLHQFIDEPLVKAIERFQNDRALLVDGLVNPGGETERNVKRDLGQTRDVPLDLRDLDLTGPVGNDQANGRRDLQAVSKALGILDLFNFDRTPEPPAYISERLDKAILEFQDTRGLVMDGKINPGGETVRALRAEVGQLQGTDGGEKPAPVDPTPAPPTKPDDPKDPDKPADPNKPKDPKKPDEPKPDQCRDLRFKIRELNEKIFAVNREETETLKQINDLKDEIDRLTAAGEPNVSSSVDRTPGNSLGAARVIVRIGGKFLLIISGLMVAASAADAIQRSQMIAAARKELAALEEKLEDIRKIQDELEEKFSRLVEDLAECEGQQCSIRLRFTVPARSAERTTTWRGATRR